MDSLNELLYSLANGLLGILVGVVLGMVFLVGEIADFRARNRVRLPGCGFCESANGKPVTRVVRRWRWRGVVALETINPITPGHIVVVSRWHSRDAGDNPRITARVMRCAAELVSELNAANIITSKGAAATQTALHLHVHIVPRYTGDELPLPWTGQVIEETS